MNILSFTSKPIVNGTACQPVSASQNKSDFPNWRGRGPCLAENDEEGHYVEMVASIGVLGFLKLSIKRDIITEDML